MDVRRDVEGVDEHPGAAPWAYAGSCSRAAFRSSRARAGVGVLGESVGPPRRRTRTAWRCRRSRARSMDAGAPRAAAPTPRRARVHASRSTRWSGNATWSTFGRAGRRYCGRRHDQVEARRDRRAGGRAARGASPARALTADVPRDADAPATAADHQVGQRRLERARGRAVERKAVLPRRAWRERLPRRQIAQRASPRSASRSPPRARATARYHPACRPRAPRSGAPTCSARASLTIAAARFRQTTEAGLQPDLPGRSSLTRIGSSP